MKQQQLNHQRAFVFYQERRALFFLLGVLGVDIPTVLVNTNLYDILRGLTDEHNFIYQLPKLIIARW